MKRVLLIIVLCITQGNSICPTACNCTPSSVQCVNKNLETIPNLENLETSPVILDFSGNNLFFVSQEDFSFFKTDEVKEVYLNNSQIADIGFAAFDEMTNLQELYLGQNYLNDISDSLIKELEDMILLDLSSNYFNGDMPVIISSSLEVLLLANSKITNIPQKALSNLPNLRLLLLQENNIKTLSVDVFSNYLLNSIFIKLSFNSWDCNCDNFKTFEFLSTRGYIDALDPYQCVISESNKKVDIFGPKGALKSMSNQCSKNDIDTVLRDDFKGYHEVRAMIDEDRKGLKTLNSPEHIATAENETAQYDNEDYYHDQELDIKRMNDMDTNNFYNHRFFVVTVVLTVMGFCIGFIVGALFCKLFTLRYKKLEKGSDSQVHLLPA